MSSKSTAPGFGRQDTPNFGRQQSSSSISQGSRSSSHEKTGTLTGRQSSFETISLVKSSSHVTLSSQESSAFESSFETQRQLSPVQETDELSLHSGLIREIGEELTKIYELMSGMAVDVEQIGSVENKLDQLLQQQLPHNFAAGLRPGVAGAASSPMRFGGSQGTTATFGGSGTIATYSSSNGPVSVKRSGVGAADKFVSNSSDESDESIAHNQNTNALKPGERYIPNDEEMPAVAAKVPGIREHGDAVQARGNAALSKDEHDIPSPNSPETMSPKTPYSFSDRGKTRQAKSRSKDGVEQAAKALDSMKKDFELGKEAAFRQPIPMQDSIEQATKALELVKKDLELGKKSACRQRIWSLLDNPDSSVSARILNIVMLSIIVLGVALPIMQSVDDPSLNIQTATMIETILEGMFLVDVSLRFCCCPRQRSFFCNLYNIIDLASALPIALRSTTGFMGPESQQEYNAVDLILLACVPMLRCLKLLRRFKHLRLIRYVLRGTVEASIIPFFLLSILCLGFSGLVYIVEPRNNVNSLPHALWLAVLFLSSVGYGDGFPSTSGGYCVSTILVACGLLYIAVPISIVGHAWNEVWSRRDNILLLDLVGERLRQWGYTAAELMKLFDAFDTNKDQFLHITEFSAMWTEMHISLDATQVVELCSTLANGHHAFFNRVHRQSFETFVELVMDPHMMLQSRHFQNVLRDCASSPEVQLEQDSAQLDEVNVEFDSTQKTAGHQMEMQDGKSVESAIGAADPGLESRNATSECPKGPLIAVSPPLPGNEDPPSKVPKSTFESLIYDASRQIWNEASANAGSSSKSTRKYDNLQAATVGQPRAQHSL